MRHLTEDDLLLHHYGEADAPAETQAHLATCAACRESLASLRRLLAAVEDPVAEPAGDFEARVWARLRPQLRRRARLGRRVLLPAALAASLLAAFLLGRHTQDPPTALSGPVRERILLVAVGEHLDRSQMLLVELAHAGPAGPVDIAPERSLAQDLVGANRLYRQTALRAGEAGVADVLDELERTLVEIAHSPATLDSAGLKSLQQRIEARGILFKVRIIDSHVRERGERARRAVPASL